MARWPALPRSRWAWRLAALIALLLAALLAAPARAQTDSPAPGYWQHAASGRLDSVSLSDLDGDGIAELLVLDENDRLTLLTADGQEVWSYTSPQPVAAVTPVAIDGRGAELSIAIVTAGQLRLLSAAGEERWQMPLVANAPPVAAAAYDHDADGLEEVLVISAAGQLLAYDSQGQLVWQFEGQDDPTLAANPHLVVADFDGDGVDEIVLGLFTPRRFSQVIYIDDGLVQWQQSISRRITALVEAPFGPQTSAVAVGTNFGQIDLYAPDGQRLWFRTLNRPISALAFAHLPDAPALVAGTTAGSIVAYSGEGRRLWNSNLAREADRAVLALLPAGDRSDATQAPLAAVLEPVSAATELADILLLGNNGQTLAMLNDTDLPQLSRLVDVNDDGHFELLLARFATLQLIGLGIGSSEYIREWEYALDAAPTATLVTDLDQDGEDEIIVGTRDGRLHSLGVNRAIRWLHAPGEEIAFLAQARHSLSEPPRVVVVRRQRATVEAGDGAAQASWLELREASGERLWEKIVPAEITALFIDDRSSTTVPPIVIGTAAGQVLAYDFDGNLLWEHTLADLEGGVRHLLLHDRSATESAGLLVAGPQAIYALSVSDFGVSNLHFASYDQPITAIYSLRQAVDRELEVALVVFLQDGAVHGLNRQGVEMAQWAWPFQVAGSPSAIEVSGEGAIEAFQENISAFLVATENGHLEQLTLTENQPVISWQVDNLGDIEDVAWDDLDKDGRPDTGLVGTRDGHVWLYEQLYTRTPQRILELPLTSGVFNLALLRRTSSQSPDLLAITQNGLVRLFREEENRPPLLTGPRVESEGGQYTVGISVADVEGDPVAVQLELLDPATGDWLPQTEQQLASGNGQLFWPAVAVPAGSSRVGYRFRYSDGFYRGYVSPPPGPEVVAGDVSDNLLPIVASSVGVLLLGGLFVYARQSRTAAVQAARFHRRLAQEPQQTLPLLESRYAAVNGSPDFLLQLANRARQAGDANVANLADGLFLLANRPQAGLSIITRTLDDVEAGGQQWVGLTRRRMIYKTCQALLEAPSTMELGLLRPQFVHLLAVLEAKEEWSPILNTLLPVINNMRDSERVDAVEDRLVYLNQGSLRVRLVHEQLGEFGPSVERTLVRAIVRRWAGLLSAEIEEQRGRAELEVSLMTKRLAPNGNTHVALEIRNTGRAPAENLVATLDDNPAYLVRSEPQSIPLLPSGRSRQVRFLIEPQAEERFRVALSLTYDDHNRRDKTLAFGDMVHLLPPIREFTSITNPYLPGTALRKGSPLFFGREELFNFIAEHAGMQSQRNVLMLVGQRRTGKTSILLRLEEYLPPQMVPVYIDCQSLGVSPGMPSLLQEFAWHIADALHARGLECTVPDLAAWQDDPTRLFQRHFLPTVRRLLPPDATLLLVFDEFEAFESLVADGILPRTVFPYMRHLMQHSTGLGFIFVGTRRLEEMSADYWSVLFNIALYRKIDFLSDEAATRLICEPVAPHIIYDDLALDKILRVTAGHPYFLQLVCYTLVKQTNQRQTGYVTISDVNAALDEMLRLGEVHFAYLWQRSGHAERAILTAAAHLMDRNEPLHPETYIEYLQSYSIELDPAEVTRALNSLVERDVMREVMEEGKALYELRIGLVGLWVARNKSLSRLHAHLES